MRGLGSIILIIGSIALGFRGLYHLIKMRLYLRFIMYSLFWFGFPFLAAHLFSTSSQMDQHVRLWTAMPLIIGCIMWLTYGFIINKKVENIQGGGEYKDEKSKIRRIVGLIICVITFIIWALGMKGFYNVSDIAEMVGSLITSFAALLGFLYLVTGKPMEKIDD